MGKLLFGVASIIMSATMFGGNLAGWVSAFTGEAPPGKAEPARLASAQPAPSGPRIVALRGDKRGHFSADIQINGQFVKALIDTGASVVALSAEDARKAGLNPPRADYRLPMQTANGVVHAARVRIPELRLQSLVVRDVEAAVLPAGALSVTLLGMSFLKRLGSFEMNGATLVLKQ